MKRLFLTFALLASLAPCGCAPRTIAPADPLTEARQRLAESPASVHTQLELSELYLQQRDYLRARQYLQVAERELVRQPAREIDLDGLSRLAIMIAVRSQQYSEAIRRCLQRLERTEDAQTRSLLASLLEATGDEWGAERNLRLLALQYPEQPGRLVSLARFYERSTFPERRRLSRELYQRYLDAAPGGDEAAQVRAALTLDRFEQRAEQRVEQRASRSQP